MPRGDRTGPMEFGRMTGRGVGFCARFGAPGAIYPAGRGGFRSGPRGWRYWFHATGLPGWVRAGMGLPAWGSAPYPNMAGAAPEMTDEAEVVALKAHAARLEQTLDFLRQRIQKLENQAKSE